MSDSSIAGEVVDVTLEFSGRQQASQMLFGCRGSPLYVRADPDSLGFIQHAMQANFIANVPKPAKKSNTGGNDDEDEEDEESDDGEEVHEQAAAASSPWMLELGGALWGVQSIQGIQVCDALQVYVSQQVMRVSVMIARYTMYISGDC